MLRSMQCAYGGVVYIDVVSFQACALAMHNSSSWPHAAARHDMHGPPYCCLQPAGSGSATESLLTGLLQHMDLSTVWKLRATEGFPQHFWASCTDAALWASLFNLNMSSCGLVSLPSAVGQLASLHVLRLNHNKLTTLPQELGQLGELEVLSVNHNQLTTLPGE